ncbi:ABC transporter substrate-binding protein, partial [Nodularia spumigena]
SDKIRVDLQRLQQVLGLTDEGVALIEAAIITELQTHKNPIFKYISNFLNRQIWNYIGVGIIGIVLGGISVAMLRPQSIFKSCLVNETYITGDRISVGEEILLTQDTNPDNPDKQAGVKAFTQGDCTTAIKKFEDYRKIEPGDPEALIYLNNAKASRRNKYLKIAVSVPIGKNLNVAKEMLRGVAQAQDDLNSTGSINGKFLKVAIANDDNDQIEAAKIARKFSEDISILAVVGHNSSKASLSAAPVYQKNKLVMITPTSYTPNLSKIGDDYIFRTAPSVRLIAETVSNYAVNIAGKTNFLMCFDIFDSDSLEFKDIFIEVIKAAGGQINPTDCNISTSNFDPKAVIDQAISSGTNALVLPIYIDSTKEALAVVQANQGQLAVFSSSTLYRNEILETGEAIKGMILAVPWHYQLFPDNPFVKKAGEIWRGAVNWRTATSYDATKAIIAGLRKSNTREELKDALRDSDLSVDGAMGKLKFDKYGDIVGNSGFLVQVKQKPGTNTYEFVPIYP